MKKFIITICMFLCISFSLSSQSLSPDVYATTGGFFINPNFSLSWTLGEGMINTFAGGNYILTQGFQQSKYIYVIIDDIEVHEDIIHVFPNPGKDVINIKFNDNKNIHKVDVFDSKGVLLISEIENSNSKIIPISDFQGSFYLLRISSKEGKLIKTIKILKTK